MANECSNTVTLIGSESSIHSFKQAAFQCCAEYHCENTERKQEEVCNFKIGKLYPCPSMSNSNMVHNLITVTGDASSIIELKEAVSYEIENKEFIYLMGYQSAGNNLFCIERIYPFPIEIIKKNVAYELFFNQKYISRTDWQWENWGTSNDVFDAVEIANEDNLWKVQFLSSSRPPIAAIKKISEVYDNLTFKLIFYDQSNSCDGEVVYLKGKCISKDADCFMPEMKEGYSPENYQKLTEWYESSGFQQV